MSTHTDDSDDDESSDEEESDSDEEMEDAEEKPAAKGADKKRKAEEETAQPVSRARVELVPLYGPSAPSCCLGCQPQQYMAVYPGLYGRADVHLPLGAVQRVQLVVR